MKELVLEKQVEYRYIVMETEVMPRHTCRDRIHLVLGVDPRVGVNPVVAKIKGYPSYPLHTAFSWLKKRLPTLWTRSTFIFTVGAVILEVVQAYIANPKGV